MAGRDDGFCPICGGAGVIRLPVMHRMRVVPSPGPVAPTAEDCSRTYPCPECADYAAVERVGVVSFHSHVDLHLADHAGYMDHVRRQAAVGMGRALLDGGVIRFQERDDDTRLVRGLRATVGAVHPAVVATAEQRAEACARTVAEAVAREALVRLTVGREIVSMHRLAVEREVGRAAEDVLRRRPWEWPT